MTGFMTYRKNAPYIKIGAEKELLSKYDTTKMMGLNIIGLNSDMAERSGTAKKTPIGSSGWRMLEKIYT